MGLLDQGPGSMEEQRRQLQSRIKTESGEEKEKKRLKAETAESDSKSQMTKYVEKRQKDRYDRAEAIRVYKVEQTRKKLKKLEEKAERDRMTGFWTFWSIPRVVVMFFVTYGLWYIEGPIVSMIVLIFTVGSTAFLNYTPPRRKKDEIH